MKKILTILILILGFSAYSQVEINELLKLNGSVDSSRQVKNMAYPTQLNNGLNALSYLNNYLLFAKTTVVDADTILLDFELPFTSYRTGMNIYFSSPITSNGKLYIKTGTLGPKEIKVYNRSIKAGEIVTGSMINILYNGVHFELFTQPNNPCPTGFIQVNQHYCIEQNERDSLHFFDANTTCGNLNARLCTWGEWYQACSNAGTLGVNNMVGNFEWIDDAANYVSSNLGAKVAGDIDCTSSYSQNTTITNKRNFRCCYSK